MSVMLMLRIFCYMTTRKRAANAKTRKRKELGLLNNCVCHRATATLAQKLAYYYVCTLANIRRYQGFLLIFFVLFSFYFFIFFVLNTLQDLTKVKDWKKRNQITAAHKSLVKMRKIKKKSCKYIEKVPWPSINNMDDVYE